MSVALLALLALGLLTPLMFTSDDNGASDDPEPTEDDPITELQGDSYTGTSGNDTLDLDPRDGGYNGVLIDAGAGDDLLDLSDEEALADPSSYESSLWQNSTVLGGEGDDSIRVAGSNTEILGGEGADDITALDADFATIEGGDGNDRLHASTTGHTAFVYGGDGNDTLSGENAADLYGEAGDDLIEVTAEGEAGDRFFVIADGGEGNDTLAFADTAITDGFLDSPHVLTGGLGSDLFELRFDEGSAQYDDLLVQPDGTLQLGVFNVTDFEPGIDQLQIELEVQNDGYTPTTARIEGSDLIIRYEHASDPIRDVVISTGTTELSFDDITFTGDHIPAVLIPTAQAAN